MEPGYLAMETSNPATILLSTPTPHLLELSRW